GARTLSALDADKLDPAEVARLYETHGVELQRLLMSVLRNPDLVAETLQSALVRALEQGHTSRGESRKGWLFRVAMNEALLVKRRQRREWSALDRMSALVAEGWLQGETPEEAASRAESAERV